MTATTATAPPGKAKKVKVDLPPPLVKPFPHFGKFARNKILSTVWASLGGVVGVFIIAGLYYLLFETNASMTNWWHHAVSNSTIRHDIRDVGEGLLGGLLGKFLVWNPYKKRIQKQLHQPMNKLDKLEETLHIANLKDKTPLSVGQLAASPILVPIYASFGIALGAVVIWLVHKGFHHEAARVTALAHTDIQKQALAKVQSTSFWHKQQQAIAGNWPKKVLGLFGSLFFGRRPVKGVFDDLQLWAAERHVMSGKSVNPFLPPSYQARFNELAATGLSGTATTQAKSKLMMTAVIIMLAISVGLAGTGWYVLTFIAQ